MDEIVVFFVTSDSLRNSSHPKLFITFFIKFPQLNTFLLISLITTSMLINFNFLRRTALFRWFSQSWCCCKKKENTQNQFTNGRSRGGSRHLHQNYDSMRTITTSLTVTSRRSTCLRPNRVVIVEHQKTILATQEEVNI